MTHSRVVVVVFFLNHTISCSTGHRMGVLVKEESRRGRTWSVWKKSEVWRLETSTQGCGWRRCLESPRALEIDWEAAGKKRREDYSYTGNENTIFGAFSPKEESRLHARRFTWCWQRRWSGSPARPDCLVCEGTSLHMGQERSWHDFLTKVAQLNCRVCVVSQWVSQEATRQETNRFLPDITKRIPISLFREVLISDTLGTLFCWRADTREKCIKLSNFLVISVSIYFIFNDSFVMKPTLPNKFLPSISILSVLRGDHDHISCIRFWT